MQIIVEYNKKTPTKLKRIKEKKMFFSRSKTQSIQDFLLFLRVCWFGFEL